jgi:hypothetical protein
MAEVLEKEGERQNILDILRKTRKAIKTEDSILLKELSSRTVHSISIYQDADSIAVAVMVYALSKIIERKKYESYKEWPAFFKRISQDIENAIATLEQKNLKGFRDRLKNIQEAINALSGHLKFYIQDVFRKAQINKASRIYEHGISAAETASLLGITQFELAEYVGRTGIADVDLSITKPIKERLQFTRSLFE